MLERQSAAIAQPELAALTESAQQTVTRRQTLYLYGILALVVAALVVSWSATLAFIVTAITGLYLVNMIYRAWLIYLALTRNCFMPISPAQVDALQDQDLPTYTILIPVYHEVDVISGLVTSIARLDYPHAALDVKILLEEDDQETQAAVARLTLPPHIQAVVVPQGYPKGKPRACNYGLLHASGEYCVIYDAEDVPEREQLKKAVLAFSMGGPALGCVQAKLNYFNRDQNLLTKLFTVEYTTHFDLILPGLTAAGAPIPLGGTSNHFPTQILRRLGGWDAYNVTEDADLGIRLARRGFRTELIDSTTYEEANSQIGNWLRQRSRWIKGYLQTWLVHMRQPDRLLRELGLVGFLGFQIVVLGSVLFALINPVFWVLLLLWYTTHAAFIQNIYGVPLIYVAAICLFVGNPLSVYLAAAGCFQRHNYTFVKYCVFLPIYWIGMSIAGWKALIQLIRNPHYWEKTRHGLVPPHASAFQEEESFLSR